MKDIKQKYYYHNQVCLRACSTIIMLLLVLILTSCGAQTGSSDKPVNQMAEDIMRAFHESDVEKIVAFYKEPFYVTRSPEQWKGELEALFKEFGKTTNVSIRTSTADTRFSGKFFIYLFDTVHASDGKSKRIRHTLTIIRPVNHSEDIEVVGHLIKTK